MWKRKKFPLIHNFQEERAFLKGASHSCSQVRRGWLVCSFTCKGRMSFVASQSYGNKDNTRLVNFKVLLFMQMPPRCLHFTFWSIQIKFWCGLGPSRNVKPNTVSVWGQDCKYPTQYCHWRFVAWQGLGVDRDHGDRARSRWNQLQTLCWVREEQQRSPSQWGLNPEARSTLNSFRSPRYLEMSHRLREANPSSALRLISVEKLSDLETFLCRNIPAWRRVRQSRLLCSMGNLCPPHLVNAAGDHHCAAHLLSTAGGGFCPAQWAGTVGGHLCPAQPVIALQEWIMGIAELLPSSAGTVVSDGGVRRPRWAKGCFPWVAVGRGGSEKCVCTRACKRPAGSFAQSRCMATPADIYPSFNLGFSPSLFFLPI